MLIPGPRGTNDFLPGPQWGWRDTARWQHLEAEIHCIARQYGYAELRPPMFEHTEVFTHGVGEATDIVQKEMFTLQQRRDDTERSLSLRPEFTAGMVRAYLENGLHNLPQPTKIYTSGPAFRAERPQKGRYRQLHQWDLEVFGAQDPAVDAEVIQIGLELVRRLGITGLVVDLNSVGCPVCRPVYRERLQHHFRPHLAELCDDCQSRIGRSPLRLLDCKRDAGHPVQRSAPLMAECLCAECQEHFRTLQQYLRALGIEYRMNPRIVRGLDYYTKTVFEILHPKLGAQSTLWGGGRYDGLMETLGGKPTPGVGFGMGMDRVLLVLEELGVAPPPQPQLDVFVMPMDAAARQAATKLVYSLRATGLGADMDYMGRSLKAQMKYAGKVLARFAAIIGADEMATETVTLKDMGTGAQSRVAMDGAAAALQAALTTAAPAREGEVQA